MDGQNKAKAEAGLKEDLKPDGALSEAAEAENKLFQAACTQVEKNVGQKSNLTDWEKTTLLQMEKGLIRGTYSDLCLLMEGDEKHKPANMTVLKSFAEDMKSEGIDSKVLDEDGLTLVTLDDPSQHFAMLTNDKKTNVPEVLSFTFPIKTEVVKDGKKVCQEVQKTEMIEDAIRGIGKNFAERLISDR